MSKKIYKNVFSVNWKLFLILLFVWGLFFNSYIIYSTTNMGILYASHIGLMKLKTCIIRESFRQTASTEC